MSSRLTRALLKLYPRRVRKRYGAELLDLQDELRAQGDVSRIRMIRDMLAGALLLRPARRARLVIGAALVIAGLAVTGAIVSGPGTGSPSRSSHSHVRLGAKNLRLAVKTATAVPYGSCFVGSGTSCSSTPCAADIDQTSTGGAVTRTSAVVAQPRPRVTTAYCVRYPRARASASIFIDRATVPAVASARAADGAAAPLSDSPLMRDQGVGGVGYHHGTVPWRSVKVRWGRQDRSSPSRRSRRLPSWTV